MTHLSDEAVAAHADGVLCGVARARALRHIASCRECAEAVRVQREAAFALRAAATPCLPGGLLERLQGLPGVGPAPSAPLGGPSGFAPLGAAAFVPPSSARPADAPHHVDGHHVDASARRRHRPAVLAVTALAVATALAAGAADAGEPAVPGDGATVAPVRSVTSVPAGGAVPALTAVDPALSDTVTPGR